MKAIYTAEPGRFGLEERPVPSVAPDEALVAVRVAAICRTDIHIRRGTATHVRYPVIPGHEFSGVVERLGADARLPGGPGPGDRVAVQTIMGCGFCPACRAGETMRCLNYSELGSRRDGGFAEYCAVPARYLFRLPETVSLEEAALLEPLANAVAVNERVAVRPGERVVVFGAGAIGLLTAKVARLASPSVLAVVDLDEARLAAAAAMGATHTINASAPGALDDLRQCVLQGEGADVVCECSGSIQAFAGSLDIVGWRGRIAVEGSVERNETIPLCPRTLQRFQGILTGVGGWAARDFQRAWQLVARGLVDLRGMVTHLFAFEQWREALDLVERGRTPHGEGVLVRAAFAPQQKGAGP